VVALERATLYGIVIYANRRVNYAAVDPAGAREIFIREALVQGEWDTRLPFVAHNRRLVRQIEELEHKSRRQDVLVDETLIHAYYDRHVPAEVCSGATMERWYREASRAQPRLLQLSRDELMRHEAAGVTSAAFPATVRLGGIDCAATYLHEPGDACDGLTVTVPLFVLNQVADARCDWLVPGMLRDKVLALLKTLPQRVRARLVPLPESAQELAGALAFGEGALTEALAEAVRLRAQLPVQRADFKLDALPPHLFMNLRVVDEHGRQLAQGRHLPTLKAQWGGQARGAFQALAALKLGSAEPAPPASRQPPAEAPGPSAGPAVAGAPAALAAPLTGWTFGVLPELLELRKGGQSVVGFPALVDRGTHAEIEVYDEPEEAARVHRAGLRRLFALQLREPLRLLERGLPDLQRLGAWYLPLGTLEELKAQIVDVALERAFLGDPLPQDETGFRARLEAGRGRLVLIAQEVARQAGTVLAEYAAAARKLKDSRPPKDVQDDVAAQLARLVGRRFLVETPWHALQHLPRYLKAVTMRLDKQRGDPARDASRLAELRPLEQRWLRRLAELKGARDARLDEYRWLLEELRVSLYAQELRTPQPVSAKRLDKFWAQISG
jgi:ATP-dependent helicase HrpA